VRCVALRHRRLAAPTCSPAVEGVDEPVKALVALPGQNYGGARGSMCRGGVWLAGLMVDGVRRYTVGYRALVWRDQPPLAGGPLTRTASAVA